MPTRRRFPQPTTTHESALHRPDRKVPALETASRFARRHERFAIASQRLDQPATVLTARRSSERKSPSGLSSVPFIRGSQR
jgi:hypothetical protein